MSAFSAKQVSRVQDEQACASRTNDCSSGQFAKGIAISPTARVLIVNVAKVATKGAEHFMFCCDTSRQSVESFPTSA